MVWGGVSENSRTALHIFRVPVTAVAYRDQVLRPIVPFMANNNVNTLQQDNARPHTARVTQQFLHTNGINVLQWPAMSPDLAPIEHVWDMLGQRIRRLPVKPQTIAQLEAALLEEWNLTPQRDIRTVI